MAVCPASATMDVTDDYGRLTLAYSYAASESA